MNLSVRSILGWNIYLENKITGSVEGVLFFMETGKLSCIKTCRRRYFPAAQIFFGGKEVLLQSSEHTKKQGENWIGFNAVSANGERIGSVYDVEFSPQMLVITRVVVGKKFLFIPISRQYYPFERIIDVRRKTVVFNTDTTNTAQDIIMHPVRPGAMISL